MFDSAFLRKKLVWPLLSAATGALVLGFFIPAGGLFVTLRTTFVGILLTVGYVDLVLKQHQSIRWAGARSRIRKRLDNFATVASTQFRIAFGFGPEIYDVQVIWSSDESVKRAELARVAKHILLPAAEQCVVRLNQTGWKKLCDQLHITWNSADCLIELYGAQLDPEVISLIIDIQDHMRAIIDRYVTFPDILGVPDNEVKPNRKGESSIPLKRAMERFTAEDVRKVLSLTVELFQHTASMDGTGRIAA